MPEPMGAPGTPGTRVKEAEILEGGGLELVGMQAQWSQGPQMGLQGWSRTLGYYNTFLLRLGAGESMGVGIVTALKVL